MQRFLSLFLFVPGLLFVSCPADKVAETEHPDSHEMSSVQEDTTMSGNLDPNLIVLPQAMLDVMTDSGSYNLDMTKTGFWTEYKLNLKEEGNRVDTIFQKHEGHYEKDLKTGEWTFYESRSRELPMEWELTEKINFRNDVFHGVRKVFKNQRLYIVEHFRSGELDSTAFYFDDFGNLIMEVRYRNGDKDGKLKEYYVGGKLKSEATFENDVQKGPYRHFYPSGLIKEEGVSLDGKADGSWKLYHPNGQLWTERVYREGMPWDVVSNYDTLGNSRPAGNLKNGNGTLLLYNDAGKLAVIETYQNGIRISEEKK